MYNYVSYDCRLNILTNRMELIIWTVIENINNTEEMKYAIYIFK